MADTTAAGNRIYEGVEIPLAGSYTLDKSHTTVEFVARHLMITKVRGGFSDFDAKIVIGEDPLDSTVDVTIDAASIHTGESKRDDHLRSPDFLDVEKYPTITYTAARVELREGNHAVAHGELTIHGATLAIDLDMEFEGAGNSPFGDYRAGFSATADINREDWGLTWNQVLEGGGVMVSKNVRLEINAEIVRS